METVKIKTQDELDKAIADGARDFEFIAKGEFEINFSSEWLKVSVSAKLTSDVLIKALGSSRVEALGSSRVVARDSSRVVALESSSVVARDSSRVEAHGFATLHLWGKAVASLTVRCHAHIHSRTAKAAGGTQTEAYIESPQDWCDYYGVEVNEGIAVVYKALNEDFSSGRDISFKYIPSTTPKANKFDDKECGFGLQFLPHPRMAREFHPSAKKFVACPVRVNSMLVFMDGVYPQKCKVPELAAPCWEVTENGERV